MRPSEYVPPPRTLSQQARSVVSLLLFVHLFSVGVALWSYSPSGIQQRLLWALRFYLQPLNFYVNYPMKFHLTHNGPLDDAFRIDILRGEATQGAAVEWTFPGPRRPWSEPYRRRKQFTYAVATLLDQEAFRSILPQTVAARFMQQSEQDSALVRLSARVFPFWDGTLLDDRPRRPGAPPPDGTGSRDLLVAKAVIFDGVVSLIEREDDVGTAPAAGSAASTRPRP